MTTNNTDGAALLPVTQDTRLWCLHHIGPDDVHPAPDFATAQKWADWANRRFAEHSDLSRFVVAIWPWSAERHAEGLAKSIEEWTLPEVGFDREWCINMAKQEAGYAIGAGELAIDPFTSSPLLATQEDAERGGVDGFEAEHDDGTFTIRFPDGHAITARADGRLIVTKAEAGFVPFETNVASLSTTPATAMDEIQRLGQEYDGEWHPDLEGHIADAVRDACNWTLGKVISFDESRGIANTIIDRIKIANAEYRAALTPSALSGDNSQSSSNAGGVEPWPGCYADLQRRRVTTLAKLGLMLSVMASGEAAEVVGYDAADLYAEVLMALAIEDADDADIALQEARDHPDGDIMAVQATFKALASLSTPPTPDRIGKDAVREALATSPFIEAITPTNDEWNACETVQDTYDLMKRRISAAISATPAQPVDETERLRAAAIDALSGWRYIRQVHGDLPGVGWDRVENALSAALSSDKGEER